MLSISQYIAKVGNRQQSFTKSYKQLQESDPIPVLEIRENPTQFFQYQLTESRRAILNLFIEGDKKHRIMYYSQSTIGQIVGLDRKAVGEAIRFFEECGLMSSSMRYKQTKLYKLSRWFHTETANRKLSHLFSGLFILPLFLLFAPDLQDNRPVVKEDLFINNQSRICKSRDVRARATLPAGTYPTRVEIMESWKPIGGILPADKPLMSTAELFRDPRLKKNVVVEESAPRFQKSSEPSKRDLDKLKEKRERQSARELYQRQKQEEEKRKLALSYTSMTREQMEDKARQMNINEFGKVAAEMSRKNWFHYNNLPYEPVVEQAAPKSAGYKTLMSEYQGIPLYELTPEQIRKIIIMFKMNPDQCTEFLNDILAARRAKGL